ncbi:putative chitin deacetylase [Papiliotrema laurentii]|uniref:chitin deacetylase n=1 Tax=Papiliotrema laurentii TaxID=5418 RepID=A0AAD9FQF4_PAPLA|nr:putative chitin deacetylase [Papiliotrema laurentii]
MLSTTLLLSLLASTVVAQSASSAGTPTGSITQAIPTTSGVQQNSINPNLPQTPLASVPGYSVPPLSELTSGASTAQTIPLSKTETANTQPTAVSGAPALPAPTLTIANYPALDRQPPVNSTEVQEWLSKIDFSKVPSYGVTDGTCAGTPGAISDGRCWWTCGGCTRETDITECPDKLTWGLSYDDGPSPYTPVLLDYLNEQNLKTTFFVVGSRVLSRPEMLQSEHVAGHQISVHTWSHPSLTTLTNEEIVAELGWTMKVIKDTIGVTPNTFRPPYGDIDDRVRAIAAQMGLTPIIWTSYTAGPNNVTNFDTTDWNIPGGRATGESALEKFEQILNDYVPKLDTGFIVLQHDLYQQCVDLAVGYVMPMAISAQKYQLKSIIDCLGKPLSEAYIETSSNTTTTYITSAASTFFQASIATGTPGASATSGANGGSSAGSASASGSAASGGSAQKTGAAGLSFGVAPGLVSLGAVAVGMALVA